MFKYMIYILKVLILHSDIEVHYPNSWVTLHVTDCDKFVLPKHDTENKITKTWMQISKKVYGRITKQGIWRIEANQEPRELYKTPDLVEYFRMRSLVLWRD